MNKVKETIKDVLLNTFKNILMSRKGLTWLAAYVMQILLTVQIAFYSTFGDAEKVEMIFWLIISNMVIQLITLGLIEFSKINVNANIGK